MPRQITIVMGPPAAGKSSYVEPLMAQGFVLLNRDTLGGSLDGLVDRLASLHTEAGKEKFVLDNTYGTVESRAKLVAYAKANGFETRCIWLDAQPEHVQWNAARRMVKRYGKLFGPAEIKEAGKKDDNMFPPAAQSAYFKKFQPPTTAEGFTTVERVAYVRWLGPEYKNKALILDYDGTLRVTKSGAKYPLDPSDVQILPGRREKLLAYQKQGYILLGASNQSGVADGKLTNDQANACFAQTNKLLGLDIDVVYCPHPAGPPMCWCRKPLPGMFVALMERYSLSPSECLVVGDSTSDMTFAKRAGCKGEKVEVFFA